MAIAELAQPEYPADAGREMRHRREFHEAARRMPETLDGRRAPPSRKDDEIRTRDEQQRIIFGESHHVFREVLRGATGARVSIVETAKCRMRSVSHDYSLLKDAQASNEGSESAAEAIDDCIGPEPDIDGQAIGNGDVQVVVRRKDRRVGPAGRCELLDQEQLTVLPAVNP